MKKKELYFTELNPRLFRKKRIIVDIDGTLGQDGTRSMTPETVDMIARLAEYNKLYLLSNKPLPERNAAFSELLNIPYLHSPYKKPYRKIVESLPEGERKDIVVIGDKYITDGLFAKRINAQFIKVKRITATNEGVKARLSYLIDDGIFAVLHFFHLL